MERKFSNRILMALLKYSVACIKENLMCCHCIENLVVFVHLAPFSQRHSDYLWFLCLQTFLWVLKFYFCSQIEGEMIFEIAEVAPRRLMTSDLYLTSEPSTGTSVLRVKNIILKWPQDWKRSAFIPFIPIPKKGNAKECSNCRTIALISHASKVMLKILQTRLQQLCEPRTFRCTSWI